MFGFLFKLIPPWFRWAALALIAAAALAWHFLKVHEARNDGRAEVKAEWDQHEEERRRVAAADALKRSEANIGVTESYRKQIIRSQAAAVAARGELDQLRDVLARSGEAAASSPGTDGGPYRELLGECAVEVARLAAEADRLASQTRGLQAYALEVCVSE